MDIKQVYSLVNEATREALGEESTTLQEDLQNIVDVGTEIFNASAVDGYVKALINHIGRVIFVNRPYTGRVPSVLMDAWEFGSVLEKISAELPVAEENESWELEDGASYDPNIFYKPVVTAKFFNKRVTFEIPQSITEKQVKQSFSNATQLNGFLSMLYNAVDKSMTVKVDGLIMRTINNMIAETLSSEFDSTDAMETGTSVKAVNLLYEYNQTIDTPIMSTAAAIIDPGFIRYAAYRMGVYSSRMSVMSKLFNVGGEARFTSPDMMHFVLLSDFAKAADVYLQSDTFHEEFTKLPDAELVPYWQASGDDYDIDTISAIDVKTASSGTEVDMYGILGVMFDRDALGVSNIDRRVTTNYNPKAEFYNNWHKFDAGYFNDLNENFVVFYAAYNEVN